MSIFGKILGGIVGAAQGFAAGGPLGGVIGGASSFLPTPRAPTAPSVIPVRSVRLPTIPRLPGKPPTLPGVPIPFPPMGNGAAGQDLGFDGACPAGFHLNKVDSAGTKKFGPRPARSYCVRNRRMNPLNGRSAMRAIRRIKGARKMLQKIERQLPKAKARRTPAHGHRVHVHSP